jgi:hypothetical protein
MLNPVYLIDFVHIKSRAKLGFIYAWAKRNLYFFSPNIDKKKFDLLSN